MADRRMFAKAVVLSDAFLDMPISARCLYFTLGMYADDDGIVDNPNTVIRICGASKDDMDELLKKRYILSFPSGVICIKHWKMSNYIPKDRYKPSTYTEELSTLTFDDKGSYTEIGNVVSNLYTEKPNVGYIGKVRIGKDRIGKGKGSADNVFLDLAMDNEII